jgi:hypothetical protein
MKWETKRKIIQWVVKVLHFNWQIAIYPPILKEERQVQTVRAVQLISEYELKMVSVDQFRFSLGLQLLTELQKTPAIKYENLQELGNSMVQCSATLKYILP